MKKNQEVKAAVVEEIKELFEQSKSAVLIDYRGLTVEEDTALRSELRKNGVVYRVLKNTLIKRAADQLGMTEMAAFLNGPTAVAFGMEDSIAPARVLVDCIKKTKKMELKIGYVDGQCFDQKQLEEIAELPSREVLIAKILGSLNAPICSLLYALNAIADQKEQASA